MVEEDHHNMDLGGLKDLQLLHSMDPNLKSYCKQWSMVVIRDSSSSASNDAVFPPSNHENLIPDNHPPSPSSPFSFSPSDSDLPPSPPPQSSPSDSDLPPSPPPQSSPSNSDPPQSSPSSVSVVPGWWAFAIRILRAKIGNLGIGGSGRGKRRTFWSFGNVAMALIALVWWVSVRKRRRWRRKERVGHLLEVIKQKDEKIIQLLNQIAQMNELLLARHKVQAAKLAG